MMEARLPADKEETMELTHILPQAHAVLLSDSVPVAKAVPMVDSEASITHCAPSNQRQIIIDTDDGLIFSRTEINVKEQRRAHRNHIVKFSAFFSLFSLWNIMNDDGEECDSQVNGCDEDDNSTMATMFTVLLFFGIAFSVYLVCCGIICCSPCLPIWGRSNGILILKTGRLEFCSNLGHGIYRNVRTIPLSRVERVHYNDNEMLVTVICGRKARNRIKVWGVTNGPQFITEVITLIEQEQQPRAYEGPYNETDLCW